MTDSDCPPQDETLIRRKVLNRLLDCGAATESVSSETVVEWFPEHEQSVATRELMRLIAGDAPVDYERPGEIRVTDAERALEMSRELIGEFPSMFETDDGE